MRRGLLVLIPLPSRVLKQLSLDYELFDVSSAGPSFGAFPVERVEAVVTNGTTGLTADQIGTMPNLSLICCFGAGCENVDLEGAERRGIAVSNAPGLNDQTVADHALALTLALARDLVGRVGAVRKGRWQQSRSPRPGLHGAAVGIIGIGRIGNLIAQRAAAFGTKIHYHSRRPRPELPWVFEENLVQMSSKIDFLIAACPGGEETRHLVNDEVFRALGSRGFLVNIARGSVVDTEALVYALANGLIAGAGLDVIEGEPAVPPELLAMENVIITPHMAGRSPAAVLAQGTALLRNLEAHFAGQPLTSAVLRDARSPE